MDFRNNRLSIKEANEKDLVNYLSTLGYEPVKIRNHTFWYLSPLREGKTFFLKINRRLNKWYDHGIDKRGGLIDFATLYQDCTVGELLQQLTNGFSFHKLAFPYTVINNKTARKIEIVGDSTLNSYAVLKYLNQRRVSVETVRQNCCEVHYKKNNETYHGIGFKNDSGGWKIRNSYFNTSGSPKDISTIKNGADELCVFEGFMDFLSFKVLHKNLPENSQDFVVLNSVSFFERARPFVEGYCSIRLYLDQDVTGINCTLRALSLSIKYHDESNRYKD